MRTVILGPLARRRRLVPGADFNLGVEDNYRIPDYGLHRDDSDMVFVDTAALVLEVLSPDDETWEKVPFYADHGVDEVVVVDPAARTVTWLVLRDGLYEPTDRSDLLDVDVDDVAGRIDWPPID